MPRLARNVLLSVLVVLVLLAVVSRYMPAVGQPAEINYSAFLDDVKASRVDSVIFQGDMLYGTLKDKQKFKTHKPQAGDGSLIGTLEKAGVLTKRVPPKQPTFLARLLLVLAPVLLIIFFVRRLTHP